MISFLEFYGNNEGQCLFILGQLFCFVSVFVVVVAVLAC